MFAFCFKAQTLNCHSLQFTYLGWMQILVRLASSKNQTPTKKYLKRGRQRWKRKYVPRVPHAHACPLPFLIYACFLEPICPPFWGASPKEPLLFKGWSSTWPTDESFSSQIDSQVHFKCLMAGAQHLGSGVHQDTQTSLRDPIRLSVKLPTDSSGCYVVVFFLGGCPLN